MNISIIGAGCVGSVLAERLTSVSRCNINLIGTGTRGDLLRSRGLYVNGNKLNITVASTIDPKPDLLFICVKNYDLVEAIKDIQDYIDESTILLPLLNSISPTPTIRGFFPQNRVLYGYIQKIDAYREGFEFKYNIAGDIHFGEATNRNIDKRLDDIRKILIEAGFNAFVDEDMIRGIWKKWMLNIGATQVSALTEANYLQFAKIPEIEHVLRLAMNEVLVLASYENVNLNTNDVMETIRYLTTYEFPKKTSMLQDIQAKRETEVEYISGDIVEMSRKWNYPCPVNLTMYYLIKSKEKTYLENSDNAGL